MRLATPQLPPGRPAARPNPAGRAFTLIELMVSIALVLIIILGVNAVFKMATDTVGAGNALGAANRDNRAIQSVLYEDFQTGIFTDGPFFLIRSEVVPAFRNRADEQADRDGDPLTIDLNDNNVEGDSTVRGERLTPLVTSDRNHRIDRVGFFASHLFRRQTGTETAGGTRFVDDGASTEAYVWYGHLDQPDFSKPLGTAGRFEHRSPGERSTTAAPNPNNYYATDWILGRSVTLLREQPPPGQNYIDFNPNPPARLTPLSCKSESALPGVRDSFAWSRYDLARTSVNAFKQTLQFDIAAKGYDLATVDTWYELLGGEWGPLTNARFQGYPYPTRPLTAYGLARTIPVFVRGCTSFAVEFAGDYLGQQADGKVVSSYLTPGGTDGQVDFMIVRERPHLSEPVRAVRRVRWYGMPRNVDTSDDAAGPVIAGGPVGAADSTNAGMFDVIPLRDLLELVPGATPLPADYFEHFDGGLETSKQNYAAPGAVNTNPKQIRYYAAWGPSDLRKGSPTRPKMIRITLTVDDPNGRLPEGQTYEYVISLP